jgi:hypothetical protein
LPSTRVHGLVWSFESNTPPNFGGPLSEPMSLPSGAVMRATPMMLALACFTPGTAATSATVESGIRSRCSRPKSPSITLLERTHASVFA